MLQALWVNKRHNNPRAKTVLLVEDDRAFRLILRRVFLEAGFEVAEAPTGKEALDVLSKKLPESLVLDLGLPDGLSVSVLERLNELEKSGKDCPDWIVTSALDMETAVRRYGSFGSHYLAKPFDPWDLVDLLEALLREE